MALEVSDSILKSIRDSLGIEDNGDAFDRECIPLVNTWLMVLHQVGVGLGGFVVHDEKETWADFLGSDTKRFEGVRTYVFIRAKLVFDPPVSTHVTEILEKTYKELEWRLRVKAENEE